MNSEAALTETWIVWIFNPAATIIGSSSCYESDSKYTKHYQQFWRYHNHISGLLPMTNSYLTTIRVHKLWHSGELHILAPLALLLSFCMVAVRLTLACNPLQFREKTFWSMSSIFDRIYLYQSSCFNRCFPICTKSRFASYCMYIWSWERQRFCFFPENQVFKHDVMTHIENNECTQNIHERAMHCPL